jgi:hypothetical protein
VRDVSPDWRVLHPRHVHAAPPPPHTSSRLDRLALHQLQPPLADPLTTDTRCQHRYAKQKRCRLHTQRLDARFCVHHLKFYQPSEFSAALTANLAELKSPEALNDFLSRLLLLLAQHKISPRRAAVLGYLTSQLLRTIYAIDQKAQQAQREEESSAPQINLDVSRPTWDSRYDLPEDDPDAPHNAKRRFIIHMPRPQREPLDASVPRTTSAAPAPLVRNGGSSHRKTRARIRRRQVGSSRKNIRRRSAYARLQNKNEALGRLSSASLWLF